MIRRSGPSRRRLLVDVSCRRRGLPLSGQDGLGALVGHLRVGDTKNLAVRLPPLVLAIAVLVLRLATL